MTDIKKEIGNRIKESRKNVNMTQTEVAKLLFMTQYSRFENGVFELSYAELIKICKLFDVSADYILGLKNY